MRFLKSLLSSRPSATFAKESYSRLVVDLTHYRCGHSQLGYPPSPADFFTRPLTEKGLFEDIDHGFEIGIDDDGRLDYLLITLGKFPGRFEHRGKVIELDTITIDDLQQEFGEPYWRDDDTDEILLFYEDGAAEVQFEFPGKRKLGFISILLDPSMADAGQRKAYGVTKPWPPR